MDAITIPIYAPALVVEFLKAIVVLLVLRRIWFLFN